MNRRLNTKIIVKVVGIFHNRTFWQELRVHWDFCGFEKSRIESPPFPSAKVETRLLQQSVRSLNEIVHCVLLPLPPLQLKMHS